MHRTILSWLLSLQMLLGAPDSLPAPQTCLMNLRPAPVQERRLWWGLIDPELSLWFSRLPDSSRAGDASIRWDFSWRGFLAALFGQPIIEEDAAHAPLS